MILHGILLRQVQLMPSLIKNSSKTHLHNKNKKIKIYTSFNTEFNVATK